MRDPIDLFNAKLVGERVLAEADLDLMRTDVGESVERATAEALASAAPETAEMLLHVTAASGGGDRRWNFWSK